MTTIKLILFSLLGLTLFLVVMHFISLNEQNVIVTTLLGPLPRASLGKTVILTFACGGLLGLLFGFLPSTLDKMLITRLRMQLKKAQALSEKEKGDKENVEEVKAEQTKSQQGSANF